MAHKACTRLLTLIVLIGLLFVDFYVVHRCEMPLGRKLACAFAYPSDGRLKAHNLQPSGTQPRPSVMVAMVQSSDGFVWAPTHAKFYVFFENQRVDTGNAPVTMTPADWDRLQMLIADHHGKSEVFDAILRTGGKLRIDTLPWGYVHNAFAGLMALGIIACIAGIVKDRFVAARSIKRSFQGLCVACGYPAPASGVCPECGKDAKVGA